MGYFRVRGTKTEILERLYSETYYFLLSFIFSYSPKVMEGTKLKLVASVGITVN